jgi:hypothetical protein
MKTKILSIVLGIVTILITSNSYATDNTSSKSKKGYVVHSVVDGHKTMTAYNKKGKWVYTIQQYSLDNLDKNLVDRIRSVYYDYGVTAIQKVEQPGMDVVYVIHLENEKSIKIARVTNDEMELVKDFIKG